MGYPNQYNYYGNYNYGQGGVPGQPGAGAQSPQEQQPGGWDQAAAAAYYQGQGWGDFYGRSSLRNRPDVSPTRSQRCEWSRRSCSAAAVTRSAGALISYQHSVMTCNEYEPWHISRTLLIVVIRYINGSTDLHHVSFLA